MIGVVIVVAVPFVFEFNSDRYCSFGVVATLFCSLSGIKLFIVLRFFVVLL